MNRLYRRIIAIVLCFVLFVFMMQIIEEVEQTSMQPFCKSGDRLVLNYLPKRSYDYGDVVLCQFEDARKDAFYILRIVGLPGDCIAMEDYTCIINGRKNPRRHIADSVAFDHLWSLEYAEEIEEEFPNGKKVNLYIEREVKVNEEIKVYIPEASFPSRSIPSGYYYVLADRRAWATDSRLYGLISKKDIEAQVVKVIRTEE